MGSLIVKKTTTTLFCLHRLRANWPPFLQPGATSFAGAAEETSAKGKATLQMLVLSWQKEGSRSSRYQAQLGIVGGLWAGMCGWMVIRECFGPGLLCCALNGRGRDPFLIVLLLVSSVVVCVLMGL